MAEHHIVLTKDQLTQLTQGKGTPLEELPINEHEKTSLRAQARASLADGNGLTAAPIHEPPVVCISVQGSLICVVLEE